MAIKDTNLTPYEGTIKVGQRLIKVGNAWMPVGVGGMYEPGSVQFIEVGGGVYYQCVSVDSDTTWSGKKWEMVDGIYVLAETVTEGLTYTSVTPSVGKVYSADALVAISSLYAGIPVDGLVFYLPLDSATGATTTGQSITEYAGTVNYTTYKGIDCGYFNGSAVLESSMTYIPYSSNPFTLSFWINIQNASSSDAGILVWGKDEEQKMFSCVYRDSSVTMAAHTGGGQQIPTDIAWDGTWKHLAFVFDGGESERSMYVYINGELKTSTQYTMYGYGSDPKMYIGSYYGNRTYIPNLTGYLARIRIYNRMLGAEEVAQLASEFTPTT